MTDHHSLVWKLIERDISDPEFTELQEALRHDPALREFYQAAIEMEQGLEQIQNGGQIPNTPSIWKKVAPSHAIAAVLGGCIAAAIMVLALSQKSTAPTAPLTPPPLASLQADFQADLSGDAVIENHTDIDAGNLNMGQGIAELLFRNGAQIVLEGKCGFSIIDEKHVVLTHGKLWAYCPREAYGFTVSTPGGKKIIDLGTEFGVEVAPNGDTEVHVYDGLVDIQEGDDLIHQLAIGQAAAWKQSEIPTQVGSATPGKFVTTTDLRNRRLTAFRERMMENEDLILYYDFDRTEDGKIPNLAKLAPPNSDGILSNGRLAAGRGGTRDAIALQQLGDGLRGPLNFPKGTRNYSISLWLNVDRLDSTWAPLLNSVDWKEHSMHFQITRSGSLQSAIMGWKGFETNSGVIEPGQWQMVTLTWDLDQKQPRIYCDGKPYLTTPGRNNPPTQHKLEAISSEVIIGGDPEATWVKDRQPRQFYGRIDDVFVFNRALSDQEILDLYEESKQ